MNELFSILMSWAVLLSGLPAPATMPEMVQVPHAYLVKAACNGQECKVMGWFPPGNTIFLDERLDPEDSLYAASVVVHEMVHYLQQEARGGKGFVDCESTIQLEREAYQAQRDFLLRYGVYQPVGVSLHHVGCELTAQAPPD
ncbi:MAG TPA: hypothetical protein VFP70_12000 [Burkholderiales bacterium]|nr:hypothetical protein [Burkholderiales bacterium]